MTARADMHCGDTRPNGQEVNCNNTQEVARTAQDSDLFRQHQSSKLKIHKAGKGHQWFLVKI